MLHPTWCLICENTTHCRLSSHAASAKASHGGGAHRRGSVTAGASAVTQRAIIVIAPAVGGPVGGAEAACVGANSCQ